MSPAPTPFSRAEVHMAFDGKTLRKGYEYLYDRRVEALAWEDGGRVLSAEVRGSGAARYECDITWTRAGGRLNVEGDCSCPVGYNCKHVVAVMLTALSTPMPTNAPSAAAGAAAEALAPDWRLWLDELKRAAGPAESAIEVAEQLVYLLDLEPSHFRQRHLVVRPAQVRVKQDGSFSAAKPYNGNLQQPARFVREEDVDLLIELRARQYASAMNSRVDGSWGARWLPRLLATGRAYWHEPTRAPLRLGPARPASLDWKPQTDGTRRLEFAVAGATQVWPLAPPWYLDLERGEAGPVQTDLAPAVAERLVLAPPLPVGLDEQVTIGLAEALGAQAQRIPPPASIEVRTLEDLEPRPCLRFTRRVVSYGYAPAQEADCALLSFAYGDWRVVPTDSSGVLRKLEGNRVTVLRRKLDAEQAALRLLDSKGFVLLSGGEPGELVYGGYTQDFWLRTMVETRPALLQAGWELSEDPGFGWRLYEAESEFDLTVNESGADWLGLALDVTVDGARVPLLPMLVGVLQRSRDLHSPQDVEAVPDERPFLFQLPDGRWFRLPAARLKPWLTTLLELYDPRALAPDGQLRLPRLAAPIVEDLAARAGARLAAAESLRALAQNLRDFRQIAPVVPPAGLQTALRPYQQQGLDWLQFLRAHGLGGLLADDMGLGKTVQALAHLLIEKESGRMDRPSLVVAPTSLIFNWKHEAQRFAPDLKVLALQGLKRKDDFARIAEHDLILTTYPLLLRDHEHLAGQEYHLVILDEAQTVKNAKSKASQLVREFRSRHRLCLTGTPMENHLGELWALMDFLTPGFLGDEAAFKRRYRTPVEKHGDALVRKQLSRRIAPFLLRRTKAEVAKELPPRTDIVRSVALEGPQRELYETVRVAMDQKVRAEIEKKGLARSQIMILDALLKLRQICCDPRLLKLDAARRVKESAKLNLLMDLLPEMLEEGRRVLLFSQFTSMLALIEPALRERGIDYLKLTGDSRDRESLVTRFQSGAVPLFLISLKAGGVGLNLTAADTVIHYDPWWNPAVEQQATDRAHRIGQDKPVFVYKLLTEGTVEEKIAQLQLRKRELADALFKEGGGALQMRPEDLAELFGPLA